MSSYNRVIILGNLTRDPQLRFTPGQTPVVDFGVATNRKWKTQSGEEKNEVCFVDCTMFGKRAEVINTFFHKGDPIFIEGRLTFESWQGQDGAKRSKLKITVENFEFVGGKRGDEADTQTGAPQQGTDNGSGGDEIPF